MTNERITKLYLLVVVCTVLFGTTTYFCSGWVEWVSAQALKVESLESDVKHIVKQIDWLVDRERK